MLFWLLFLLFPPPRSPLLDSTPAPCCLCISIHPMSILLFLLTCPSRSLNSFLLFLVPPHHLSLCHGNSNQKFLSLSFPIFYSASSLDSREPRRNDQPGGKKISTCYLSHHIVIWSYRHFPFAPCHRLSGRNQGRMRSQQQWGQRRNRKLSFPSPVHMLPVPFLDHCFSTLRW